MRRELEYVMLCSDCGGRLFHEGDAHSSIVTCVNHCEKKIDLRRTQDEMFQWQLEHFGLQSSYRMLLGVVEEIGELALADDASPHVVELMKALGRLSHSHLKQEQDIRGTPEEHEKEARDAVGDITVYLINYCQARGWIFNDILHDVWAEVRDRKWQTAHTAKVSL